MRKSTVTTQQDASGSYETEIFDCASPKRVIITAHGNGVRRWDGGKFYYNVAEHYADAVVMLVDQNQAVGDGCQINPLPILVSRVQRLIDIAKQKYGGVPIIVIGHSMGCGVVTQLNLDAVEAVIFVSPAVGAPAKSLVSRYGADIVNGKTVKTSDGLTKIITKEYYQSVQYIVWEDEYQKLTERFSPVYVFESGDDEIVGEGRFAHRTLPFTSYEIINGAKHNFSGAALSELLNKIDKVLVLR